MLQPRVSIAEATVTNSFLTKPSIREAALGSHWSETFSNQPQNCPIYSSRPGKSSWLRHHSFVSCSFDVLMIAQGFLLWKWVASAPARVLRSEAFPGDHSVGLPWVRSSSRAEERQWWRCCTTSAMPLADDVHNSNALHKPGIGWHSQPKFGPVSQQLGRTLLQ